MIEIKKLVDKLDRIFSMFIRLRECNNNGIVKCFTSGVYLPYKEMQAGHYISRRHYATRWDEKNVQPQSVAENIFNQGNAPVFGRNLDLKYGNGTAEMLLIKKNNQFKLERFILEQLIKEYTGKVKQLKLKKGL